MMLKAFANGLAANIKCSKTQLFKMVQLEGFIGTLAGILFKTGGHAGKERVKKDIKFAKEGVTALKDATPSLVG